MSGELRDNRGETAVLTCGHCGNTTANMRDNEPVEQINDLGVVPVAGWFSIVHHVENMTDPLGEHFPARRQLMPQPMTHAVYCKWACLLAAVQGADQEVNGGYVPECIECGQPQTRNPHPNAGVLSEGVGYVWHCIPCLVQNRHRWAQRAMKAEGAISEALRWCEDSPVEDEGYIWVKTVDVESILRRDSRESSSPAAPLVVPEQPQEAEAPSPENGYGGYCSCDGVNVCGDHAPPAGHDTAYQLRPTSPPSSEARAAAQRLLANAYGGYEGDGFAADIRTVATAILEER